MHKIKKWLAKKNFLHLWWVENAIWGNFTQKQIKGWNYWALFFTKLYLYINRVRLKHDLVENMSSNNTLHVGYHLKSDCNQQMHVSYSHVNDYYDCYRHVHDCNRCLYDFNQCLHIAYIPIDKFEWWKVIFSYAP